MKYTTLLFDNDDTLMDFGDAERQGIIRTFEQNGVPCSEEHISLYSAVNLSFWKRFERGEIEKKEIFTGRFKEFSRLTGYSLDPEKVAADYLRNLAFGHKCIDGARELLSSLYGKYDIYLVTNGERKTTEKRVADSSLGGFYKDVFVSEASGYQKPQKEYFDYVFERIREKDKSRILIIGDSLTSDIAGGINAGIDTCWYNRRGESTELLPTYEIHALEELYDCL